MMGKWYRQSSEIGPQPACFMRLNEAAAAEEDHILTEHGRNFILSGKCSCSPSPNILTKH